jgi:UDP-N-acetylglucosamine acyltransferase
MMEQGATLVGDGNFLMAGAHLGHDVRLGNRVIVANNTLLGGHVEVGDRAFLGGGAVFHQFVQIGELAIIQGNSAFSKNIPPYLIGAEHNSIFGINVVGIRRAGFDSAQRREIKEAFNLLYRSGFNTAQALEHAKSRPWSELGRRFFDFVSTASKRGICDLHHSHARTMPV